MTDEELNNLFCTRMGYTDKDFSYCKNDCEEELGLMVQQYL